MLKNATMFESLWLFFIQVAKLFERPSYLASQTEVTGTKNLLLTANPDSLKANSSEKNRIAKTISAV